jgi:hypothetical protein
MNTAPFSNWDEAAELIPWGAESFGVWLFLVIAIAAFIGMLVRAVQHENACMVHIVTDAKAAEANRRVEVPEAAVAAAVAS